MIEKEIDKHKNNTKSSSQPSSEDNKKPEETVDDSMGELTMEGHDVDPGKQ